MTVSLRRALSEDQLDKSQALHAPLFQNVLVKLDPSERSVLLDLGAASTAMLALFSESRCCVEIADVAHFGGCDRLNSAEPGPGLFDIAEALLPERVTSDPVDIVFCWDLPNYLSLPALKALMQAIGRRSRGGTIAHALIYYAERNMPKYPGRFVPTEDRKLENHALPGELVSAPRYSPEDLTDNMSGFAIDRARLLGNGMQEFLFRF